MDQPEEVAAAILYAIIRLRSGRHSPEVIERVKLASLEMNLRAVYALADGTSDGRC